MSRTRTLWLSAILTLAIVVVVGTLLLRPGGAQPTQAQPQPVILMASDAGVGPLDVPAQPVVAERHDDDHDEYEHHKDKEDHDDDD